MIVDRQTESREVAPGVLLARGDWFTATGGPRYDGQRIGRRGLWEYLYSYVRDGRTYVRAVAVTANGKRGDEYTFFVWGPRFEVPGMPRYRARRYRLRKRRGNHDPALNSSVN